MTPDEDPLRSLPELDAAPSAASRTRRLAHAELVAAHSPGWRRVASRAWTRVGLPAAIVFVVAGYLRWAVDAVSALHR